MEKLSKRSPRSINWCTTTVLLWQIIVMLGQVDAADDNVTVRTKVSDGNTNPRVAVGGDGPSLEVDAIQWIDWTPKQDASDDHVNVISSVIDIAATESMMFDQIAGERIIGMDAPQEEKNKVQDMRQKMSKQIPKKPRILCLHGNKNALELEKTIDYWPESITGKMDLVFINGTFPDMNGGFNWFNVSTYDNLKECYTCIEDRMIELGPFDGLLGFSQGGVVVGAAPGLQQKGHCLKNVGKIEHVVVISGAVLGGILFPIPSLVEEAFYPPINIPSLHIFGENDKARFTQPDLVEKYVDPLVVMRRQN